MRTSSAAPLPRSIPERAAGWASSPSPAARARNLDEVERAVEEGYARFGKIDILVNNAAGNFISPTEQLSPNAFRLISDIVWMGAVHTSLTLGKRWIAEKQEATIMNVLTVYARTGSGYVVPSACFEGGGWSR